MVIGYGVFILIQLHFKIKQSMIIKSIRVVTHVSGTRKSPSNDRLCDKVHGRQCGLIDQVTSSSIVTKCRRERVKLRRLALSQYYPGYFWFVSFTKLLSSAKST